MAANHGSTSSSIQTTPVNGRSARIQRAERSRIDSATAVKPTNIRISGPLTSTPAAIAVHRIAGSRQPAGRAGRAAFAEIDARHGAHRRDRTGKQHRVGLGEPRLNAEHQRTCHHQGGEQRRAAADESERRPIGQQHAGDRAGKRRQPIEPDGGVGLRHAERPARFDRGGLQPVDADRLLVAHLVLETDVDVVAAFDHLLGGLGKARLVAVDRRDLEEAGQEGDQRRRRRAARRRADASPPRHRAMCSARTQAGARAPLLNDLPFLVEYIIRALEEEVHKLDERTQQARE